MKSNRSKSIRIAIVGCGAVTENNYLPILSNMKNVEMTLLIDKNLARIKELAKRFNVDNIGEDFSQVVGKADAAIIALPNNIHSEASCKLLAAGIHVLVEKPMAPTIAECDEMIDAAKRGNAVLSVGLMRRFLISSQFVKTALENGILGKIESFDIREGGIFNWPVASNSVFQKSISGGGVLIDTGAHTLDSLIWWLGEFSSFEYYDDNHGGVESNCLIHVTLKNGAKGIVELSRTRRLRNSAIIKGEKAEIEVSLNTNEIYILSEGTKFLISGNVVRELGQSFNIQSVRDLFMAELNDWIESIMNNRQPAVSGEEGKLSIPLIEECYKNRKTLKSSWI